MPAIRAIPVAVEGMFKLVFLLNTEFKTERLNNYPNRRQWVTPKTMCNHNTISRNEKNRLTLVILQSFSFIMLYIHAGNGSVFKSLNLIEFIWLEGKATFCHTNPLNISEIWTAIKPYISILQTSNLAVLLIFFLLFPFLAFGRSSDPLLQTKAYCYISHCPPACLSATLRVAHMLSVSCVFFIIFTCSRVLFYFTLIFY